MGNGLASPVPFPGFIFKDSNCCARGSLAVRAFSLGAFSLGASAFLTTFETTARRLCLAVICLGAEVLLSIT